MILFIGKVICDVSTEPFAPWDYDRVNLSNDPTNKEWTESRSIDNNLNILAQKSVTSSSSE